MPILSNFATQHPEVGVIGIALDKKDLCINIDAPWNAFREHSILYKRLSESLKQYNSSIPKEIKDFDSYKKAIKDDFKILYCSNDETPDRKFGIVKIVMTKEVEVKGKDELFADIHENITLFQCLEYRVNSKYIKGLSQEKYIESLIERIQVAHDLLD